MLLWITAQPPWGEGEKDALTYISRQEKQGSAGLAEQRRSLWWAGLYFYSSDVERTHPACALAADCGDRACVHVWRATLWLRLQEFRLGESKWIVVSVNLWITGHCFTMPVLLNLQSRERSLAACEKIKYLIVRNTCLFFYGILVFIGFELHF